MKVLVENMYGDAAVFIYNKNGEIIHIEGFTGKTKSSYVRDVPVTELEYSHSNALFTGEFSFKVIV